MKTYSVCFAAAGVAALMATTGAAEAQGYGPRFLPHVRGAGPVFLPPPVPRPFFVPAPGRVPPPVFVPGPFAAPPFPGAPGFQPPVFGAPDYQQHRAERPSPRRHDSQEQRDADLLEQYGFTEGQFDDVAEHPQEGRPAEPPQLSDENQIVLGCASKFGVSKAAAACAIKGFTANELRKCQTHGIGGRGCFGDKNTLVAAAKRRFELTARETTVGGKLLALHTGISLDDIRKHDLCGGKNSECNKARRFLKKTFGIKF